MVVCSFFVQFRGIFWGLGMRGGGEIISTVEHLRRGDVFLGYITLAIHVLILLLAVQLSNIG